MPTSRLPCSNAAKTWNPLKFAEVPQTRQQISAASGPKFTILWGHVEEILLCNIFFPIVDIYLIFYGPYALPAAQLTVSSTEGN